MKAKQKGILKNITITGVALMGGLLTRELIKKVRFKNLSTDAKIHEAPWPEALRWTLAASIASGVVKLILTRYTHAGISRMEN